jgi:hypothetical protein
MSLPWQALMGFGAMAAKTEPVQTRRVSRISLVSIDREEEGRFVVKIVSGITEEAVAGVVVR